MVNNLKSHHGGRIWVIWRPQEFDGVPLVEHAQFLHMCVKSKSLSKEFFVTVVYGDNRLPARNCSCGLSSVVWC